MLYCNTILCYKILYGSSGRRAGRRGPVFRGSIPEEPIQTPELCTFEGRSETETGRDSGT